jgi:arginyl-tRNA synthetase
VTPLEELHQAVRDAAAALGDGAAEARLERPRKPDFGDYSTNAALLLAPALKAAPREIAERLGAELADRLGAGLERVEIAGPGFLNLFLAERWFTEALGRVIAEGEGFGGGSAQRPERIDIEFVSANPTGPLTVAHGRHAAHGDALARILEFEGHDVTREFYINDYGSQVVRLAESVRALARGEPLPEDGYRGDYVAQLVPVERARELELDELGAEACAACMAMIRATLERFGVRHDVWFSERSLHEGDPSRVERALAALAERGDTYSSDGALWLRTSAHGDDKDRVLERSSGEHTYFTSDIAYHQDKLARGFERLIDIWGADHHGYMRRMSAAFEALGGPPGALELLILQFVHLVDAGGRTAMSKRKGEFVTLDELIDEIGVDAARFFLLQRSHETTVELDLALAVRRSNDNPVYYVQYAHARIASMLAKAGAARVEQALAEIAAAGASHHPSELALLKKLLAFPAELGEAAARRAPHRIAAYALELAQDFTAFYRDCRVVGAEPQATESFRIALSVATQRTIARALGLLGVSAPSEM